MSYGVQFTLQSRNVKTGPIPVSTTSNNTCPNACPLKNSGCYAESGNVGILWRALSATKPGEKFQNGLAKPQSHTWDQFCDRVAELPKGQLWRHNQAGDLPGGGDTIDLIALAKLVEANACKRGFTYTHKPIDRLRNRLAIKDANAGGFTINLSADNLQEADDLADSGAGPVVTILPMDVQGKQDVLTPTGRRVVVCPATYMDNVTCASCQLCQRQERKVIVGFPAHGASRRKASAIAVQS